MNWRIISASAIGTSHTQSGKTCEDTCLAFTEYLKLFGNTLFLFVSDGAGSAEFGGAGAEIAVERAAAFFSDKIRDPSLVLDRNLAISCVSDIRKAIEQHANRNGRNCRDYACTFLGAISTANESIIMQLGDGGIAIDIGEGLSIPITPMAGEYANMTNFVTDDNAIECLESRSYASMIKRVAIFSDGLQRIAMDLVQNTPYIPFFSPFFSALRSADEKQEEDLQNALIDFLNSARVNERTDDDKTLAVAHYYE